MLGDILEIDESNRVNVYLKFNKFDILVFIANKTRKITLLLKTRF
jgi:hypothetical protein